MSDTPELTALRKQVTEQEQRIIELEIEAAFRRRASEELDEVVREQADRLAALARRVQEVVNQLEAATHEGEVD